MDTKRNYANIARRVISPTDDGQNLQQFISDSPWEAKAVFYQIQSHITCRSELCGGMLTLDESGFERAGNQSAALPVWTVTESGDVQKEWLFARQEPDERLSFSMSNAKEQTNLTQLAFWRSQRYFAERTFQDAKTEAGWDELVARKYRAFIHHTALDALALWFVTETKLDWNKTYPRNPSLALQFEIEKLPGLSMANIRELLKAVMPLEQLSPQQAIELVVGHLVNRSNSTRSRQKAQPQNPP
jgi:SRSO17 transposase